MVNAIVLRSRAAGFNAIKVANTEPLDRRPHLALALTVIEKVTRKPPQHRSIYQRFLYGLLPGGYWEKQDN